jgi:hypothetical protein
MQARSWRSEYYDLCDAAERASKAVNTWPKELAIPIIAKLRTPWEAREFRAPLAASGLHPYRDVLAWVDAIRRELATLKLEMVSGDAELCDLAQQCARLCTDYPDSNFFLLRRIGIAPPEGPRMTADGVLLRLQCVRWWRRKLRAHFGQAVENAMRERGYVCKQKAAYCTDWALRRRTSQRLRTETMLKAATCINEDGEQMSLFDAAQSSVSNPVNRRGELMTRIRGFEELATERGHVALFCTLTVPSCYHAQHHGGGQNVLYNEAQRPTVAAAQAWLCRMWSRARAKLHRLKVAPYGFRIAEPHHDGTPHWHALLFLPAHQLDTLRRVVRGVWLSEHGQEKGAAKYRAEFKKINPALGDAAGYVAKYVAKNIDGFNVGKDYEAGEDSATTAHRVDAWASTHRIRQFQQIGGARVGVWRELRRSRRDCGVAVIEEARMPADAGDWCAFSKAAQGVDLWKEQTGECNAYKEIAQPKVIGIECGAHQVRTRLHEWSVNWSGSKCTSTCSVTTAAKLNVNAESICNPVGASLQQQPASQQRKSALSVGDESASEARSLGPVSITVRGIAATFAPPPKNWRDDMWQLPTNALRVVEKSQVDSMTPYRTSENNKPPPRWCNDEFTKQVRASRGRSQRSN